MNLMWDKPFQAHQPPLKGHNPAWIWSSLLECFDPTLYMIYKMLVSNLGLILCRSI